MYSIQMLGMNEALKALNAVVAEADKELERPLAFAIVDQNGDLLCCARMDKLPLNPQRIALQKAYTAARMRSRTKAWGEGLKTRGMPFSDYGDSMLIPFQRGLPIMAQDGTCIVGIGVSGRRAEEDEAVAEIGPKANAG